MEMHLVSSNRGLDWLGEGFELFKKNPLIWIVLLIVAFVLVTLLNLVPLVGSIASILLQPVLIGGMLLGCRDLEQGEELRMEHLFEGFRQNTQPLIMIGVLTGAAYLFIGLVTFLVVGSGALGLGAIGRLSDFSEFSAPAALLGILMTSALVMVMVLPVTMATWFAPALVLFGHQPPVEAMRQSFFACLKNWLAFLVYGVVLMLLTFVAMIPAGLGLLVLAPTVIGSIYAGYRDIFGR